METVFKTVIEHSWDVSEAAAEELQIKLASLVSREDGLSEVTCVAGVDVAYDERRQLQVAAAVVLDATSLEVMACAVARQSVRFPYIPGLFSFRELPAIVKALELLDTAADLVVCDGHGLAHPRRFGLACHLGVLFDIPTIGCGKTRLAGEARVPGPNRGDRSLLVDGDEIVGCALRTQDRVKPVYVSAGHRVSLESACQWILRLTPSYRLPETTRRSNRMAKKAYRQGLYPAGTVVPPP